MTCDPLPAWRMALALPLLLTAASGCDREPEHRMVTIEQTRIVEPREYEGDPSSLERFGYRLREPEPTAAAAPAADTALFTYEAPNSWEQRTPSSMRLLNFLVGGEGGAECYVAPVSLGGGAKGNVDRWRRQVGLEPLSDAEFLELPRDKLMGVESVLLDATGSFQGMAGEVIEDARLLGLYAELPATAITVKMIGPAEVVTAARPDFIRFGRSLALASSPPASAGGGVDQNAGDPHAGHDHAKHDDRDPRELEWTVPSGWRPSQGSGMRLVTLEAPGENGDAQCWITPLPGHSGTLLENINRWRSEMGAPAIGEAELSELETVTVLGQSAAMLDLTGPYTGMGGPRLENARMFGVVGSAATYRLYIKMVGEPGDMASQRRAFVAFCESIRWGTK